jgi:hypothetical protein
MDHDHGYKLLFSHAAMVEDLLRGFVREAWVEQVDFATLEKVSGSYVSDDLRDREDDVVWRVRWGVGDDWLYVYLLLEFQSRIDPYMAVRIMTYVGLLYQDLIRTQQQSSTVHKLPPVLPLVLYNGQPRWTAAQDIAELIEPVPGGLQQYRPRLRYLLLDEGRFSEGELAPLQNVVATLFRLENSRGPAEVQGVLDRLVQALQGEPRAALRRAFTVWIKRVFLKGRMPGVNVEALQDLHEVRAMLAEKVVEWTRQWEQQGVQKGEASLLLRLLERKFGPLDPAIRERVMAADVETLSRWGDNLLTANTLEQVFE